MYCISIAIPPLCVSKHNAIPIKLLIAEFNKLGRISVTEAYKYQMRAYMYQARDLMASDSDSFSGLYSFFSLFKVMSNADFILYRPGDSLGGIYLFHSPRCGRAGCQDPFGKGFQMVERICYDGYLKQKPLNALALMW